MLLTLVTAGLALPAATEAVVPPKDCGRMTVGGKPYQVKSDQISCTAGRRYAKAYLQSRTKPQGYRCTRPSTARNRVTFYCNDGRKIFFAIRR